MELQRHTLEGYQLVFDGLFQQEETLESIVPDAFPDIARIVSVTGRVSLREHTAGEGTLHLSATAHMAILYIPEGESSVRALEVSIPVQCAKDRPHLGKDCMVHCCASIASADTRAVNPRKLLTRVEVVFSACVYRRVPQEVTAGVECGDKDPHVELRTEHWPEHRMAEVMEKPFSFSDVLRLPASKPEPDALLYHRVEAGTLDAKIIGKKLVCKGEVSLVAMCQSDGALWPAKFELPFSQIFDASCSEEGSQAEVRISLDHTECRLEGGELEVSIEAQVQAVIWAQTTQTILADLYATSCVLEVERTPVQLCIQTHWDARRESGRTLCQSAVPIKQVLDCTTTVCSCTREETEGGVLYTAQTRMEALCLSEEDALYHLSCQLSVPCRTAIPGTHPGHCQCRPMGETTGVPVTGGVELRTEVEFSWVHTQMDQVPCVTSVRPREGAGGGGPRPSVILRMAAPGETLWDIAKSCASTIQDIQQTNQLSEEQPKPGTLLLIPTKRG